MTQKLFSPQVSSLKMEYFPPLQARKSRPPLLLVLHGLGSSGAEFRDFRHILPSFFGLLLLNAPDPYLEGYSWFDLANPSPGILRSRSLLFSALEEIQAQAWAPESLGIFAFSQGALLALDVAARYPKALGAIVAISGFVFSLEEYPESFSSVYAQQKVFASAGTFDPLIRMDITKSQIQELLSLGMNIQWKEYDRAHCLDPVAEMKDIENFLRTHFTLYC